MNIPLVCSLIRPFSLSVFWALICIKFSSGISPVRRHVSYPTRLFEPVGVTLRFCLWWSGFLHQTILQYWWLFSGLFPSGKSHHNSSIFAHPVAVTFLYLAEPLRNSPIFSQTLCFPECLIKILVWKTQLGTHWIFLFASRAASWSGSSSEVCFCRRSSWNLNFADAKSITDRSVHAALEFRFCCVCFALSGAAVQTWRSNTLAHVGEDLNHHLCERAGMRGTKTLV